MKQFTTCASVANKFFKVLQGYTKGIRFTAILTLLFTIGVGQIWAEGTETFENLASESSYGSRSWTGVNGQTWKATLARTDQKITGNRGLTFSNASSGKTITMVLTEAQRAAGIGTFTFKYKHPYSDSSKNNTFSISVNGSNYSSGTLNYTSSSTTKTITINAVPNSTSITITITGTARLCVDDFSWTSYASNKTVYLKPTSAWDVDGAKFAVYYFNNSTSTNGWSSLMTKVDNKCNNDVYKAEIPSSYTNLIFVRLNNTATAGDWNKKWDQTADLTLSGTNNMYTISAHGSNGGKASGSWSAYKEEVQVTYNFQKTGISNVTECVIKGQTTANKSYNLLGWKLEGWYKEAACTNQWNFSTTVTSEMTLYAKWSEPATTTIYLNANSNNVNWTQDNADIWVHAFMSSTGEYKDIQLTPVNTCDINWLKAEGIPYGVDKLIFLRVADGAGVVWSGSNLWNQAAEIGYSGSNSYYQMDNWSAVKTATAYQPSTYTISYNSGGGAGSMASTTVECDGSITLPANSFTRTGYTFNDWKDASGKTYKDKATISNIKSNITLTAQWEANTYYVKFNANNGSGSMSNQTFTYGTEQNLTANAFTRTGYTFAGWNTKADGSGTSYADKASVKNLSSTNDATVNLFAQWTPITYSVNWVVNGAPYENGGSTEAVHNSTYKDLTLPTAPDGSELEACYDDKVFVGWSTTDVGHVETNTKHTLLAEALTTSITANTTFYAVFATETPGTAGDPEWIETELANITASDVVVITMTKSTTVYALSSANGSSSAPEAPILTISNGKLSANPADALKWNISNSNGTLTIYPNGKTSTWLYCTATNNGVRVGTNSNKSFTIDASSGYLKNTATSRFVGVYTTNPDWRCYTSTATNIDGQTLKFYKETSTASPASYSGYVSKCYCVTEIKLAMTGGHKNLDVGDHNQLLVTYTPTDATCDNAIVSWTSSNDNVMSVSNTGLVTAERAGNATITAKTEGGVTATYTITVNNPACDSWYIHYWNNSTQGDECFYKVKPDDANDHEWRTNNFSLPSNSDEDKFIVNNTPEDQYKTDQIFRTGIGFADIQRGGQNCGTNPYPGQDALGQLSIYDDSNTPNRYIAFYPAQYLVTYGKEGAASWEVLPFKNTTGYEYETEPFMVPNGYKTDDTYKYYVGIINHHGNIMHVTDKSSVDAMNTVSGLSANDMAGKWGTWHIYSNSCDANWYCEFISYYRVDFDLNGGEGDFAPRYGKATTPYVTFTTTDIGAPTRDGYKFLGWKDQNNKIYAPTGATVTINKDLTLTALWIEEYPSNNCRWEEVTIDDIEYGDEVVVTMTKSGYTYALNSSNGTSTYPKADQVTVENKTITSNVANEIIWNISGNATDGYVLYPNGSTTTWLYCTKSNNTVKVGTSTDKVFTIQNGYFYHINTTDMWAGYLGVSITTNSWRHYPNTTGVIEGQTLKFYKKVCLPEGHYRVTWMVNGQEYTEGNPTTIAVDGVIEKIPTAPDDETLVDCEVNKFMGWSEDNIGSMPQQDAPKDLFTDVPTTPITENKTFYAVFAKVEGGGESVTWKETFDTNKGTGGNDDLWSGTIATSELLSDHTWSFYNAKGAYQCAKFASNSNGGSATTPEIDCGSSTEATLTFKAGSWKDDKTILSIMATNCTIDLSSVNLPDQKWEEYTINITNIIGKITITFSSEIKKRFFLDEVEITSSGGTSYSDYITLCDNSKVWAKYDLNGGTGASACTQTLVTKDAPFNLCSETPTKDGYTFNGWSDGTKTYAAGAEVIISKTTTFYATWKANTVTITWDLNYADSPEAATSEYVYDGDEIEMPADPTRTGYTFTGWYTTSTGGTEITEVGEENKPTSDVTYYAHWLELYTVTYMASGQVYVKQEYKYLSGDKLQLPENDPTAANFACDGYLFEGWSKYQQTKEDANRPELVDANTSVENDIELHAVWKKASTSGAGTQIFYESFDSEEGTGANDNEWGNDVGSKTLVNDTWTFSNGYGAYQCVKLGSSKNRGSATTPALTQLSGDAKLSFKAAAWVNNNETTTLNLSISGGGTLTPTSVTLVKGAWTTYEVQIKDGTPSSKITFEAANASNNRFFLDEVMITTSGSYNYTTSPSCGPTMVAKENVWGTSANGQSVKVNVPIGVKMFEGKATITGTSTNENFVVNTLENVGNGEHNVVVVYTPTAEDIKENTTITLTAKNGEEIWSTTTFTLHGRSLPAEFVVVANKGDKNYALPANMPEAGTFAGFEVQVNGDEVIAAPKSHLYNLCAVHSTRYGENGTAVRLVGNDNACLWASSAAKSTDIRNWAKTDNAKATNYEWSLYTEDGDTYRISSTAVTEEGRVLRYNGEKFGMYKEGTDVLRLLPVGCSSTPLNVQVSPARVSAIVSWTNAGACELVVKQGGVTVVTLPSATSPAQVSNLAESTAYTFTLIPNDDASCGVSGAFTTTGPSIDIVEWNMGGIRIQVDKDEDVNPIIIINGEEEHGDVGGQVATELFFSKYFEAHGENKLLAVYNGTTQTIDLNGYVIKHGSVEIDLSQYGQTKGSIASNEEIIFVSFDNDATKSAEPCAEKEEGFSSWNVLTTDLLAFSGRGSIGLYKDDVLIDLIGSIYPSGELTKIGKAGKSDYCGTGDDVQLHVDGVSVNDQSSFFCHNGDNIKTPEVETDYPISTNRCLLIRKNSVTSGADAVASNKAVDGAKCGDLSSTFATLCSEWGGFRIGSGRSSDDEIQDATCEGLGYVGGFDYNNYYRTMETIYEGTKLDEYDKNSNDNTYFIEFEVSEYACLNIQLQLTDESGNVLTDQITQVPILVYDKKTTTDELFSAIVKDGETPDYENSKIRCATCDVVIQYGATLTKADPETPNDVNQVRDIYVYPGGKLIIPEGATDYSVNSVSLRRDQDDVSMADIQTPLNITSSSKTPVYVDVRINSKNWHWLSLPYNCNIADVTWKNGSKALYNSDWFLMYYDGESRVNEQSHYENHWKLFEGTTIEAGKGYIVGITGHATKSGVQYELRFPMAAEVLTHEKKDKTVAVNAWGVNMDVTPNKKGWNLVGNPYLDYYQPSTGGFAGLPLIKYTNMDPVTGEWHYDNSGDVPFIVTPVDGGWYEYRQDLASEVDMKPFTSYFVQVGQPDIHENDVELSASFTHSQRGRSSLIRRAPQEVNEIEEPIIVGVELTNSKGESDKTTLIIDDRFTSDYEMNADFFKWFGDYYKYYTKPVLYSVGADAGKRAFNALSEQLAAQPIPLGMFAAQAGDYTFTLTRKRCDLSSVEEVWLYDATTATYTNLMQSDYTFQTAKTEGEGRFYLSVKMRQNAPTDITDIYGGNIVASAKDGQIIVDGLTDNTQLWIYDATGKLLYTEQTTNFQHVYEVPVVGTYFVRTLLAGQAQTIKVLVE